TPVAGQGYAEGMEEGVRVGDLGRQRARAPSALMTNGGMPMLMPAVKDACAEPVPPAPSGVAGEYEGIESDPSDGAERETAPAAPHSQLAYQTVQVDSLPPTSPEALRVSQEALDLEAIRSKYNNHVFEDEVYVEDAMFDNVVKADIPSYVLQWRFRGKPLVSALILVLGGLTNSGMSLISLML
ncbi:hypothetical protein KIPB_008155, partial [Kipferlia bialata]